MTKLPVFPKYADAYWVDGTQLKQIEIDLLELPYYLNYLWDWAEKRLEQKGHPYYAVLAQELRAIIRSYK